MKRMSIIILILMFTIPAFAPVRNVIYIEKSKSVTLFDPLLYSFQYIESNFRVDVVNYLGYTGILQEGPEMIAEANRICKMTNIPMQFSFPESALDSLQSVQIGYIVQNYHNPNYN